MSGEELNWTGQRQAFARRLSFVRQQQFIEAGQLEVGVARAPESDAPNSRKMTPH
jgi:hypothetical protein